MIDEKMIEFLFISSYIDSSSSNSCYYYYWYFMIEIEKCKIVV